MKICTKCNTEKPATTEYFYKNHAHPHGLSYWCKDCRKAIDKEYHDKNKDKRNKYSGEYHHNNKETISEKRKDYNKEYYQKNKEQILARTIENYYKNRDGRLERCKEYRKENKEKRSAYFRKYRQSERGKELGRIHCQRWKALKRDLPATFTVAQWKECKKHFDYTCAYCGKATKKLAKEHFVPVSKGGVFTVSNIVPSCRTCNSSKNNKDFFEWYPSQAFYSKQREKKILRYLNIDKHGAQQASIFDFTEAEGM